MWQKIAITCAGTFIVYGGAYYQAHAAPPWVPVIVAGLLPIGAYLTGLFQDRPGQQAKP